MKYENITLQQCIVFEKKSGHPIICDGDKKIIYIKDAMEYIGKLSKTLTPIIQTMGEIMAKNISNLNKIISTLQNIKNLKYKKIKKGKRIVYKIR